MPVRLRARPVPPVLGGDRVFSSSASSAGLSRTCFVCGVTAGNPAVRERLSSFADSLPLPVTP
ncbi:hypothetical protein ACH4M4_16900 [Streptomyces sp. NPDC017254]